jgi:hypothetical protein
MIDHVILVKACQNLTILFGQLALDKESEVLLCFHAAWTPSMAQQFQLLATEGPIRIDIHKASAD